MNRTVIGFTLLASLLAWACSGEDSAPFVPVTDTPTAIPADTNASNPPPTPDSNGSDLSAADAGDPSDATPSDTDDGGKKSDAGPNRADAAAEAGTIACVSESEPNDVVFQQMPRSLCGKLTAGDVDRFYIEGRQDEPIELIFSSDGDALVTLKTNAGLSEAYFAKSFKTTVKPGDRKLFVEVALAKGPVAYHFAFERK
jgi:hypothetical protein